MPTEEDKTKQDGQDPKLDGEKPPVAWEEWLKGQPEEIRQAYEGHVKGLKTALDSEREAKKALEKAEREKQKAAEDAEAERLKKQGEYQKLAEAAEAKVGELEKRVAELESVSEKLERYDKALGGYLAKEREGLAPHIIALLDNLDVVAQLEWIANNKQALVPPTQNKSGVPPTPAPDKPGQVSDEERKRRAWQPRL